MSNQQLISQKIRELIDVRDRLAETKALANDLKSQQDAAQADLLHTWGLRGQSIIMHNGVTYLVEADIKSATPLATRVIRSFDAEDEK
jgi:hypothetical protein